MASKERYKGTIIRDAQSRAVRDNVEEAWFWFIAAQQARVDGARFASGAGMIPRPCEPVDILNILRADAPQPPIAVGALAGSAALRAAGLSRPIRIG
jgi:hypothetical protein